MKPWKAAIRKAAKKIGEEDRLDEVRTRVRSAIRLLRPSPHPLQRHEGIQPFFIVGSGRAGTTLLRRILQSSEEVHIPPEIWSFKRVYYKYIRYGVIMDWEDLTKLVAYDYVMESGFDDTFKSKLKDICDTIIALPSEERSLAAMLDSIYRYHGDYQGTSFSHWGDKTPLNSFCMDEINNVFGSAKFIHLVRDGVDVVSSYLKYGLQPNLQAASNRWRGAVRAVKDFEKVHPDRVMQLRYEDLVRDPDAIVRDICTFINIPFDSSMIESDEHVHEIDDVKNHVHHKNVFRAISSSSIGKGRDALDATSKQELQLLIGEDLVRLGYDPVL